MFISLNFSILVSFSSLPLTQADGGRAAPRAADLAGGGGAAIDVVAHIAGIRDGGGGGARRARHGAAGGRGQGGAGVGCGSGLYQIKEGNQ